jgi:hypothetical protein
MEYYSAFKKEGTLVPSCNSIDESEGQCVKWSKSDTGKQVS